MGDPKNSSMGKRMNIYLQKNLFRSSKTNHQSLTSFPLFQSYEDLICPLWDAVHTLYCMNVIEEDITLPSIVVIGDRSSGKSSVIESLTGLRFNRLPHGETAYTRVPMIISLQRHSNPVSELSLEYEWRSMPVYESTLSIEINHTMKDIADNGNGISDIPLILVVKSNNIPVDHTIVDLPGFDQYEAVITSMFMQKLASNLKIISEYTNPEENIILNVMSSTTDFKTCKSMRMSKIFDKTGKRTLHVFAKADMASKDLVTIVTTNIGPDYISVRNLVGKETHKEARTKEANLFKTHHFLSKIDKSIVGIPMLAQKLAMIQIATICKCLPEIVKKINEDLKMVQKELEMEVVNELKGDGDDRYGRILEESPRMATKKWKLENRMELLTNSKKVIENTINNVAFSGY